MERMMVMVSMDSANQHLASLAGTRVLTLWGATTPACGFMPYGQREEDSYFKDIELPAMFGGRHEKLSRRSSLLRSLSRSRHNRILHYQGE